MKNDVVCCGCNLVIFVLKAWYYRLWGRYSEDSLFRRFPNPDTYPTNPTNHTNPKVGNLQNNEPSEYPVVKVQNQRWGNGTFRFGPPVHGRVLFYYHCNSLKWANALSHKLEVGERRSLASHYTLTTGNIDQLPILYTHWSAFKYSIVIAGNRNGKGHRNVKSN